MRSSLCMHIRLAACALALLAAVLACCPAPALAAHPAHALGEWSWLDFDFTGTPQASDAEAYVTQQVYRHALLGGVLVWRPEPQLGLAPQTFVNLPRIHFAGSTPPVQSPPYTLAHVDFSRRGRGGGPLLVPFKGLPQHKFSGENPFNLVSVTAMEVDPFNRLWLVDNGRVGSDATYLTIVIKIIVWDLVRDAAVSYHFPDELVAPSDTADLNAIVVDHARGFAYISDSGVPPHLRGSVEADDANAGIIVYSHRNGEFWRLLSRHRSTQPEVGFSFLVNSVPVLAQSNYSQGVSSLGLTPDGLFLFMAPLSSRSLYRVPTCLLRGNVSEAEVGAGVVKALELEGATAAMSFSYHTGPPPAVRPMDPADVCAGSTELTGASSYELFLSDLEHNSVVSYVGDLSRINAEDINAPGAPSATELVPPNESLGTWVSDVDFGEDGSMVFTSNRFNSFMDESMDFTAGVNNFHLSSVSRSVSTPMYSYQSLIPSRASTFSAFFGIELEKCDKPSSYFSNMQAVYEIDNGSGGVSPSCNYVVTLRTSYAMRCALNESTGVVEALVDYFNAPGCLEPNRTAQLVLPADGRSCARAPLWPTEDRGFVIASCSNYKPTPVPSPPEPHQHTFLYHGLVDTCDGAAVGVYYAGQGECTFMPDRGHSLLIACDEAGNATVQVYAASTTGATNCTGEPRAVGVGRGNGRECVGLFADVTLAGSASVRCGAPAPAPADERVVDSSFDTDLLMGFGIAAAVFVVGICALQFWRTAAQRREAAAKEAAAKDPSKPIEMQTRVATGVAPAGAWTAATV